MIWYKPYSINNLNFYAYINDIIIDLFFDFNANIKVQNLYTILYTLLPPSLNFVSLVLYCILDVLKYGYSRSSRS